MGQKNKILIVGQKPPPYLGQAIMTKLLLDTFEELNFKFKFIDQTLSKKTSSFHKIDERKILIVILTVLKIFYYRIFRGYNLLYYNPSGHRKIAILRDMATLFPTRWLFKKTIFHFHAYGLHIVINQLNPFLKIVFKLAFNKPDLMIKLTPEKNPDEILINPKKIEVLPNACRNPTTIISEEKKIERKINIVYVGAIYEERGIDDVLNLISYSEKINDGLEIEADFIGEFMNKRFESLIHEKLKSQGLNSKIRFLGRKLGESKNKIIEESHFLIFPSRVPSETFGLVLIEAMSLKTPPISTNLNGPKYVIEDGKNGIKYEPGDIKGLYRRILFYTNNRIEYNNLRDSCYRSFKTHFTEEIFRKRIKKIFQKLDI